MRTSLVRLGSILLLLRPFVQIQAEDWKVQRPDLCQTDESHGKLPGGGKYHCVPTSISNHLVALSQKFPGLMSQENPTPKDQAELIWKLSSPDYMNTIEGTTLSDLVKGLKKYVEEKGYSILIECKGEKEDEDIGECFTGEEISAEWIKEELKYKSNLILSANFYKNENGNLQHVGAHAVTVVGFNDDDGFKLHIHDPAERSGIEPKTETCDLVWHSQSDSKSKIELRGINLQKGSDVAYLGFMVAFNIEPPENN